MSRRVMFVLGAEGSGTNMLAASLVSAGCYEDPRHRAYMDDYEFEKMPDLLMFRRSFPHAQRWPDVKNIYAMMELAGYGVRPLFILRDWYCTIQSIMQRNTDYHFRAVEENMRGAVHIISELPALIYISYESFCLHSEFRRWLFVERLGLKEPTIEIKYANPKYYEKELVK